MYLPITDIRTHIYSFTYTILSNPSLNPAELICIFQKRKLQHREAKKLTQVPEPADGRSEIGTRQTVAGALLFPPHPYPLPVCAMEVFHVPLDAIQTLPGSLLDATSWAGGQRNINSHSQPSTSRPSCKCPLESSPSPNHFFFLTVPANEARCPCHTHISFLLSCLHAWCALTSDPHPVSCFPSSPPADTSPTQQLLACRIPEGRCWTRALRPGPNLAKIRI